MRKNDAFDAKIVNTRLTKGFMTIFAPAESLPSPATLPSCIHMEIIKKKPRKRIGLNPALKICQNKLSISYNVYFWRLNFKMRTESKVTMGLHSI